jgi:hypothetical protein
VKWVSGKLVVRMEGAWKWLWIVCKGGLCNWHCRTRGVLLRDMVTFASGLVPCSEDDIA